MVNIAHKLIGIL